MPTRITRDALSPASPTPTDRSLVEALGAAFYADAHLPGAINIPAGHVDGLAPGSCRTWYAIVVYGTGTCEQRPHVAGRLEELGYRDVAVYEGGKEDWVEHGLPVERPDDADEPASATTALCKVPPVSWASGCSQRSDGEFAASTLR